MIWLYIFGLCCAVFAYIAMPLFFKHPAEVESTSPQENIVNAYRLELIKVREALEVDGGDKEALTLQKLALQKRLIESSKQSPQLTEKIKPFWAGGTFAVLLAGTLSVYWVIGSPKLTLKDSLKLAVLSAPQALSQNTPEPQHENDASMEDLVSGLEEKLQAGGGTLQQWGLYARSLMTIGRYADAFAAYEKTLELSGNNPDIAAELKSARAFAAQQDIPEASAQPGPNQEDIAAAAQMSPNDRAAMIQGMVEGLAEKLAENPDDPSGWIRLLRARKVLGQNAEAQIEISSMKVHFVKKPDVITQILRQSGWNN